MRGSKGTDADVLIVGGGPVGLAAAAALQGAGLVALVLERGDAIGSSWRGRYDRLRLNTSRWFSMLPGGSYAAGTGVFPTRDEVVSYLEGYARDNALDVRLRTPVDRIDPDGAGWAVRTSAGDFHAQHVVVAAGYEHTPFVPAWPGPDPDCMEYLARRKVMTLGIDSTSMRPLPDLAEPTHYAGLKHGMVWTESAIGLGGLPATGAFYCMIGPKHANDPYSEGRAFAVVGGPLAGRLIASARKKKVVRQLWGIGKGNFRTKGKYASAAIRGTQWLTQDRCDGTNVRVTEGTVTVRDLVKKKNVAVTAPKSYFAAAPKPKRR